MAAAAASVGTAVLAAFPGSRDRSPRTGKGRTVPAAARVTTRDRGATSRPW